MVLVESLNESLMPLESRHAETFTSTEPCLLGFLVKKVCNLNSDPIRTCNVRYYRHTFCRYGHDVRNNDFKFMETRRFQLSSYQAR